MRVLARLLIFIGAFYLLEIVAVHLGIPTQVSAFMAVGFVAGLVSNRMLDGRWR